MMDAKMVIFLGLWLSVASGHRFLKVMGQGKTVSEEESTILWLFIMLGAFLVGMGIMEHMK